MPKLFYLCAVVLLFGAIELAYRTVTDSKFFMVFGVSAAILGGLGAVLLQGEKEAERTADPKSQR